MSELNLLGAFLIGLLGGVHCVGMCGGIVSALSLGVSPQRASNQWPLLLGYNAGRIISYTVAGVLVGGLGMLLASALPVYAAQRGLQLLAGLFMLALGLYLAGWWMGLGQVERLGQHLWRRIEPLGRRLLPVRSASQALTLGLIWGWLPCGLVYSVLIWAVSAGSAIEGALLMLAFGLGTLPNLLLMGTLAAELSRWTRRPAVRQAAGAMVIAFGFYSLFLALSS